MPGMSCSSWPTPVTIEAAHTGVTEGNAATQSGTYRPPCTSRSRTGAAPASIARSSIAGAIASITHSTSLVAEELTAAISAAQDAQPRVLFAAARAPAPGKPCEQRERHVPEWMQQRYERRQHHR